MTNINKDGDTPRRVSITINDRREFHSLAGVSLLTALMDEQVFIPSACGGRGACGQCKVKVVRGAGTLQPRELRRLTPDEQAVHLRLSCQVTLQDDLRIEIPEDLLQIRRFDTRVVSISTLTHDIRQIVLQLIRPDEIIFKAGQYIQLIIPAGEWTPKPVLRAYSVASPPTPHQQLMELEIRRVAGGIGTSYIFEHLKAGDPVTVIGPYGDFYVRDTARSMILIAGGSGMAPMKSILYDLASQCSPRRIRYFFGAQAKRDLFCVDEMRSLEQQLPDFRFIPALSTPLPDDEWTGETGLITDVVDRHVHPDEPIESYLCGSPGMIDACIRVLSKKGIPGSLIYHDKFA